MRRVIVGRNTSSSLHRPQSTSHDGGSASIRSTRSSASSNHRYLDPTTIAAPPQVTGPDHSVAGSSSSFFHNNNNNNNDNGNKNHNGDDVGFNRGRSTATDDELGAGAGDAFSAVGVGASAAEGEGPPVMEDATICMTVVEDGPNIAFACYDEERNEIIVQHCHVHGYETEDVIERFITTTRPNLVLVGNKIIQNTPLLTLVTRRPPDLPTSLGDDDGGEEGEDEDAEDVDGGASTTSRRRRRDTTTTTTGDQRPPPPQPSGGGGGGGGRGGTTSMMAPSSQSIPYRLLKSGAFDVRACRSLILQNLRVLSLLRRRQQRGAGGGGASSVPLRTFPNNHHNSTTTIYHRPSTYHALAAIIDFDSKVLVQALGSLLSFLQTTLFRFEDGGTTITINKMYHASSTKYVTLDTTTFAALHIFATEHHPLAGVRGKTGNSKEGFSLYSLLDRTMSQGGKKLLREWMLKPLLDINDITSRQDAIESMMQQELQTSVGMVLNRLADIGPIDSIILRMQKCTTKAMDFLILTKMISAAVSIHSTIGNHILPFLERHRFPPPPAPAPQSVHDNGTTGPIMADTHNHHRSHRTALLCSILERCELDVLRDLEQRITDTVDAEATSQLKHSVVIRHGFHEQLDSWKEQYETLEEILEDVGGMIYKKNPSLGNLSVVFVPQVGFLVALDKHLVFNMYGEAVLELPSDFSHLFNQDEESFFKNNDMQELDQNIGDLDGYIKDTEGMIVTELEEDILDTETELRGTFNALSELDCILSLAACAEDLKFVRPQVIDNKEGARIYIKDGRHPLQEIVTENEFVPNDTRIDDEGRVNIITGPNFSGKSCYARHVGVLVYMAHIGSFLPCTQATISITDHIFARFDTVETCAVPQSSFQLNLTQMATILRRSTPHSLVLIDEFGKGTSPTSGISLLTAALKKLAEIRCKVVCTTHFLEIFSLNLLEDGKNGIKVKQMTVRLPDSNNDDDGAAPLFKLREGVASSSAGLICARAAGVNPKIVDRAKEINRALRDGRKVKPLKEALPPVPELGPAEKAMLRSFFSVENWNTASDEQLRSLLQTVARL